jgi:hypothetical protein
LNFLHSVLISVPLVWIIDSDDTVSGSTLNCHSVMCIVPLPIGECTAVNISLRVRKVCVMYIILLREVHFSFFIGIAHYFSYTYSFVTKLIGNL